MHMPDGIWCFDMNWTYFSQYFLALHGWIYPVIILNTVRFSPSDIFHTEHSVCWVCFKIIIVRGCLIFHAHQLSRKSKYQRLFYHSVTSTISFSMAFSEQT